MKALDQFGTLLVKYVRDEVIDEWYQMLEKKMKDDESRIVHQMCSDFTADQLKRVKIMFQMMNTTTLHNLLMMLQDHEEIVVSLKGAKDTVDIREASDGLAGELYGKRGWIARYSKYQRT